MNEDKKIAETPLMKQYFSVKSKYPEAILLFRVGDFYETYGEDAIVASKILGIILTRRANGSAKHVEMAGFPYHAIDTYLPKLVRAGYKVAICDQLEDPKLAKKIVKRGITELVTPGVVYNEQLLTNKENNYLAAIYFEGDKAGVAFLDISTGSFKVSSGDLQYIELLLNSFAPKEILLQKSYKKGFEERFGRDIYISTMDEWAFVTDSAREKLQTHFGVTTLKGFGIDQYPLAITAAGAILYYLELTQHEGIGHICSISRIDEGDFVWIDRFTFRNLEVFKSASENGSSLTEVIDRTSSPMGARLLRNWLAMPVKNVPEIEHRQNIVEKFLSDHEMRDRVRQLLKEIGDQERIISRAAAGKITPREVVQLRRGLENTKPIKDILNSSGLKELTDISLEIDPCDELLDRLTRELIEDPASQLGKGDVIANGISQELDSLRKIVRHGKEILDNIQAREIEKTGISSLKVSYNNVFGYYLEVRNTHKEKVPNDWIRKQTLVNAERYITQELKEYEEKIMGAEEKIINLETSLFFEIISAIRKNIATMQKNDALLSKIDLLASFAELAHSNNYKRPLVNLEDKIIIQKGRHPVIETIMAPGEEYIPNDLYLDNSTQQIMILTGPNMSGKSALLRQTALIVLLAQIGSFVPAESATIGMIDKIFTRVGATDNISRGESTFMIEMLETATILHNLSNRSLVLLDEIGRGTSTYDGMSIARAIIEYIHEHKEFRAKTIFATHYHELNDLENMFERVKNYHISVKEVENRVVFLRKLLPGGVAHSFGIHVARMAGMPQEVVKRAERILKQLENKKEKKDDAIQLSLFQLEEDPLLTSIRDELKEIDINKISPLEAFDILRTLKQKAGL
ncbi:MAG TPA: DNA mismatch repair protein MutS [Bacteroidales bacterium]|jgi:DNA mismatch repair protein MutS|nr:DNA mismatch repair protein MutS [Bacteroidales bacterium]